MAFPKPKSISQAVTGIYEAGHIRLLEPLNVPEGTTVSVQTMNADEEIIATLKDMLVPANEQIDIMQDNHEDVLAMLRERLQGISLSQAVNDERDERI